MEICGFGTDESKEVTRPKNQKVINSSTVFQKAHSLKVSTNKRATSVTSVVFINDHLIASASSDASSGVRIWDIRKQPKNDVSYVDELSFPLTTDRQFGITSLAVDRYRSRLYAAGMNNVVCEYAVTSALKTPVRHLLGSHLRDFHIEIACSPVDDVIACGDSDSRAVLWDLTDRKKVHRTLDGETIVPSWTANGHQGKVTSVSWSSVGKYFATVDETGVRLWSEKQVEPWPLFDEDKIPAPIPRQREIAYEEFTPCGSKEVLEALAVQRTPRTQRKRPFPSSSSSAKPSPIDCPSMNLRTSPRSKLVKFSTPQKTPLQSPLKDLTNFNTPTSPRAKKKPKYTAFYKKYPTQDLPNFVYEKFVKKLLGESNVASVTASGKRKSKIDDWWQRQKPDSLLQKLGSSPGRLTRVRVPSVTEFGASACANVLPEEERLALNSPRKIVVRLTPIKPQPKPNTPKAATPKSTRPGQTPRKTSRNLFDFFNKK
ncbi:unnamed protein product [Caenorhabditis auriculariae]|uniref:Uncharacterized protein n=1 Tax=Caenorhabditis auriculariae TaxID=2777116 RepID=A0A8S1H3D1_9PELO|nr:unnamed protein product [Caenorhabditis auriculariae]